MRRRKARCTREIQPLNLRALLPGPLEKVGGSPKGRLGRLTQHKNKAGDITSALAWDDLTCMKLDAGTVIEARTKEVTYLRDKRVYDKIPRHQAVKNKWKIIRTRWIDINTGDDENPVYRSRLVGKEFNTYNDLSLYAATPPLEALRLIFALGGHFACGLQGF